MNYVDSNGKWAVPALLILGGIAIHDYYRYRQGKEDKMIFQKCADFVSNLLPDLFPDMSTYQEEWVK